MRYLSSKIKEFILGVGSKAKTKQNYKYITSTAVEDTESETGKFKLSSKATIFKVVAAFLLVTGLVLGAGALGAHRTQAANCPDNNMEYMGGTCGPDDRYTYSVFDRCAKSTSYNDIYMAAKSVCGAYSVESQIYTYYRVALGEEPDTSGFDYWRKGIVNGTTSSTTLAQALSAEMLKRIENGDTRVYDSKQNYGLSDTQFIDLAYTQGLKRPADNSGKQYWQIQFKNGLSRDGFANKFFGAAKAELDKQGISVAQAKASFNNNVRARLYGAFAGRLLTMSGDLSFNSESANKSISYWTDWITKNSPAAMLQWYVETKLPALPNTEQRIFGTYLYANFGVGGDNKVTDEISGAASRKYSCSPPYMTFRPNDTYHATDVNWQKKDYECLLALQFLMKTKAGQDVAIDGRYYTENSDMINAVKNMQRMAGANPTGVLQPDTLEWIFKHLPSDQVDITTPFVNNAPGVNSMVNCTANGNANDCQQWVDYAQNSTTLDPTSQEVIEQGAQHAMETGGSNGSGNSTQNSSSSNRSSDNDSGSNTASNSNSSSNNSGGQSNTRNPSASTSNSSSNGHSSKKVLPVCTPVIKTPCSNTQHITNESAGLPPVCSVNAPNTPCVNFDIRDKLNRYRNLNLKDQAMCSSDNDRDACTRVQQQMSGSDSPLAIRMYVDQSAERSKKHAANDSSSQTSNNSKTPPIVMDEPLKYATQCVYTINKEACKKLTNSLDNKANKDNSGNQDKSKSYATSVNVSDLLTCVNKGDADACGEILEKIGAKKDTASSKSGQLQRNVNKVSKPNLAINYTFIGSNLYSADTKGINRFDSIVKGTVDNLKSIDIFNKYITSDKIAFNTITTSENFGCSSASPSSKIKCSNDKLLSFLSQKGVPANSKIILLTNGISGRGNAELGDVQRGWVGNHVTFNMQAYSNPADVSWGLVHEIGHNFGLLDEYTYDKSSLNSDVSAYLNSAFTTPNQPFHQCIAVKPPANWQSKKGAWSAFSGAKDDAWYEGAKVDTWHKGCSLPNLYRSSGNSIMRFFNEPNGHSLSPSSAAVIENNIDYNLSKIL